MSRRYPHLDPPFPPSHYLVIDIEATCDTQGWERDRAEIIEIGAVLVDATTLAEVAAFQTFIRPVMHPCLTAFCTELTTITQAQIDTAPSYAEAIAAMRAAVLTAPRTVFCSWGSFDENLFRLDCARRDVPYPFEAHWNVKAAFTERARARRRYGLSRALERVGLAFEGTPHRGLDDARNVVRLLPWCLGLVPIEKEKPAPVTTDPTSTEPH